VAIRLAQVAARAGVSTATASRVLNQVPSVDASLAERVLAAAADLRYERNRVARNLRLQRTDMIGVLISDIQNPHFSELVYGIERAAFAAGFGVLLCNTDEQPERQRLYLRTLAQEQVAGLILSATADSGDLISEIMAAGTPVVAVDREVAAPGADAVVADNAAAATLAATRLIQAGHQRVALIAGPLAVATAAERHAGYLAAMHASRLPPIVEGADFRAAGGREAMRRILGRRPRPTAVIVSNNLMATGALEEIARQSVAVPQQIALISFDDPCWAALVAPPLTVLAQPVAAMAVRAVSLLASRIGGERGQPLLERFEFELRVRRSCGTAA